jgi:hypothetical protein
MLQVTTSLLVYNGTKFDSAEETYFAMWLDELQKAGYVRKWRKCSDAIPLTDGLKISYVKTTQLKTKIKHEDKDFIVLRPSEYTPDFDVIFTPEGIVQFVNYIEPAAVAGFDTNRPFFSNERLRCFFEIKPSFDQNNMERLFRNNQKFIWDKHKIFVNLVEPVALFKKTFLPLSAYPFFKYRKSPTGKKNKNKKVGDWKMDWSPVTLENYVSPVAQAA